MKKLTFATAIAAAVSLAGAAPNLIMNGSFEVNTLGPGGTNQANPGIAFTTLFTNNTKITNWTVVGNSVDYDNQFWQTADGFWSVDLSGNAPGGLQQTVGNLPKGKYDLSFSLSGDPNGGPKIKSMLVQWGSGQETFTYTTGKNTRNNMLYDNDSTVIAWRGGNFSISFQTNIGAVNNTKFGPVLDNVALTAAPAAAGGVPSPAAALPMIAGLSLKLRRKCKAEKKP